jgi:predicted DNA-binding transcriptional regulator AlpA
MGTNLSIVPRLLNDHQVAELLSVSVATVRRWRMLGQGPRFLKVGTLCKYRAEDIDQWLDSRCAGGEICGETRQVSA